MQLIFLLIYWECVVLSFNTEMVNLQPHTTQAWLG